MLKIVAVTIAMVTSFSMANAMTDTQDYNLEGLLHLKQFRLDELYANATPGRIPNGDSNGKATFFPGSILSVPSSLAAALIWQGKVFDVKEGSSEGFLTNKVLGFRAIKAKVFMGKSWYDGNPAIIVDYQQTSLAVPFVRDEIREISPGIYLGRAYLRTPFGHLFALNFALDFNSAD